MKTNWSCRVWLSILLLFISSHACPVESYDSLKKKYDKALAELKEEYESQKRQLDAAFETALIPLKNEALQNGNAELFIVCDDGFSLCINGKIIIDENPNNGLALIRKKAIIKKGDIITVKCTNKVGDCGFCCVIKFPNGSYIASDLKKWKAYTPKSRTAWYDRSGITQVKDVTDASVNRLCAGWANQQIRINSAFIRDRLNKTICYLAFVVE